MRKLAYCGIFVVLAGFATTTRGDVIEQEPNNTFATRHVLSAGERVVTGQIYDISGFDSSVYNFTQSGQLVIGEVTEHNFIGTADQSFIAWIDSGGTLDTYMGTFDENGTLIAANDDGSPDDYFASWIGGTVNPDNSINLKVTSTDDGNFQGSLVPGNYDLFVKLDGTFADVDFFTFTDLTPGEQFAAEITAGDFDTLLARYDDDGNLIHFDDNSGVSPLSKLTGIVPDSGLLNFAISTSTDPQFLGLHYDGGDYELTLTTVPEPATLVMWLLMGVAYLGFARRRQRGA